MTPRTRTLVVEADGGSRGNPGPAGYGALVRDPETGEVLEEISAFILAGPQAWGYWLSDILGLTRKGNSK